jgi:hypothetical protein
MSSSWTNEHYLAALRAEVSEAEFAAIVIGYERQTRFVWSGRDDPTEKLESVINQGGKPIAILGADIVGNAFVYRLTPFPKYEDDPGTREYLAAVGEQVASILEQRVAAVRN